MTGTEQPTVMLPPGEQLRRKREQKGLDMAAVAKALLLSVKQVEAIENSQHDSLPGPTYIIGYWKNYAALLGIDLRAAIEQHKIGLEAAEARIALDPHHQRVHGHREKSRKKSAVIFFALSVAFLSAVWYWQNPQHNPLRQWMENLANRPLNALDSASEPSAHLPEQSASPVMFLDQDETVMALPEPNFSEDDQSPPENGAAPAERTAAEPAAASNVSAASGTAVERIQFTVTSPSWLDVRDAAGENLVNRNVATGETLEFSGQPPFSVFIDAAAGVEVRYLGEVVEFEPHASGLFARFQVPNAARE